MTTARSESQGDLVARAERERDAARRHAACLQAIIDHALGGYALVDARGQLIAAAPSNPLTLGRRPQDVVGRSAFEFTHPDDLPTLREAFAGLLQEPGRTLTCLVRQRHADGRWVWLDATGCNLLDHPAVGAVVVGWRDVTAQVDADERHGAEAELYRRLVEGVQAIPWEADAATLAITYIGRQVEKVFGFPAEAWLGAEFWAQRLHPEDRGRATEFCLAQTQAGQDHTMEYRMTAADGRVVWILDVVSVTKVDGKPARMSGFFIDITERKRAEEERRQLQQRLLEAQKLESLGVLAGGVAHEFNNILTTIRGFAGLAAAELPADAPARAYLGQIDGSAARAADLCRQMLAYAGRGQFIVAPVDLSGLVRDTGRLLQMAVAQHATLNLDLAPAVPPVQGDAAQLRQVVVNLVANASEALGEEPGVVRVRTGVVDADRELLRGAVIDTDLPEGKYAFVEVADTGRGMTAETLARIFDPFFTTKFAGRGLGLAAVLGVVRSHKGAVRVQSRPGQGSTFQVLLPVTTAEAAAPPARRRLLVVDDEESVRLLARLTLEKAGYEVLTAEDGRAAIDVFQANPDVAAVLLDLAMPRMGGLDALAELRRLAPPLRVLLVSGYSPDSLTGRLGTTGVTRFLQKPYTPTELVAAVGRILAEVPA